MELILRKTATDHILIDGLDDLPVVKDCLDDALSMDIMDMIEDLFKTNNSVKITII